jgi:hypothetical protein
MKYIANGNEKINSKVLILNNYYKILSAKIGFPIVKYLSTQIEAWVGLRVVRLLRAGSGLAGFRLPHRKSGRCRGDLEFYTRS